MWDALYSIGLTSQVKSTIDTFAVHLLQRFGTSPIATNGRNHQVVHDYLNTRGMTWSADPSDVGSVIVGNVTYPAADRSHVDAYLTHPTHDEGGAYPAQWVTANEDSTSGHALGDVLHDNAMHLGGPKPTSPLDPSGTGWTAIGSRAFTDFNHETNHALRHGSGSLVDEFLAAAAEVIGGIRDTTARIEVPYHWSLLAPAVNGIPPDIGSPSFTNRFTLSNYQGRTSFMAYMAYNFLNADTARTLVGMRDDLLHKWILASGGDANFQSMMPQLADATCATCATKSYFHPGGIAMSTPERLNLVHHNWRVANFVNSPILAERQYGFPAWSGFSPALNQKAWQDFDGTSKTDIVALPAIISLNPSAMTRETTLVGERTFRGMSHPLALVPFGSQYWVIRATGALLSGNRTLMVRISPRAFLKCPSLFNAGREDVSLIASAVAYDRQDASGDRSDLWSTPGNAVLATGVQSVATDSSASDIELQVPEFGASHPSVLVVLTAGDGPTYQVGGHEVEYAEVLPYRLDISVATTSPGQSAQLLSASPSAQPDDNPTWSPSGGELAYFARDPAVSSWFQIYRRNLSSGSPTRLAPQANNQFWPDWSPRGDLVAFEASPSSSVSDIYIVNPLSPGATPQRLTFHAGCESAPGFQPNGQGIAYWHIIAAGQPIELRWTNITGTDDHLVATLANPAIVPPRWSASGNSIVVFDNTTNRLLRYPISGGTPTDLPGGLRDMTAFDLHPGKGRVAVSSTTPLLNRASVPACFIDPDAEHMQAPDIAAGRLALMDTTFGKRDTSFRFVARGTQISNIRWAPNGTHIAFSRGPVGSGDRDLYYASTTVNRAPTLATINDQGFAACVPFVLPLSATDPDGEPISYQVFSAPPGSGIVTNNVYRWQYPDVGEYFVVFKATDQSGGVSSQVVKFTVFDDGSCEGGLMAGGGEGGGGFSSRQAGALAARNTSGAPSTEENSVLDGAPQNSSATRVSRLPASIHPDASGSVALQLRMAARLTADIDRARLITLDHAGDEGAWSDGETVVTGRTMPVIVLTGPSGSMASPSSLEPLALAAGEWLEAQFSPQQGAHGLVVSSRRQSNAELGDDNALEVSRALGEAWQSVGLLNPRQSEDAIAIRFESTSRVRIVAREACLVTGVLGLSQAAMPAESLVTRSCPTNSEGSDAAEELSNLDGSAYALSAGESIPLAFEEAPLREGYIRSRFLEVTAAARPFEASTFTKALASTGPRLEFGLQLARPNPFSGLTQLGFTLPVTSQVVIEVLDLQGRRVRSLAISRFAAGRHTCEWDARDETGKQVRPGVYLVRMSTPGEKFTQRVVLRN